MSHLHALEKSCGLELAGQALHTESDFGTSPVKRLFPAGHSQTEVHKSASPSLAFVHFSSQLLPSANFTYEVALHVNSVDPSHTAKSGQTTHPL